jgi:DNA-binding CsgD family transcriptional regulator
MILGRTIEVDAITQLLDAARGGDSGCLRIRASAGMGKTALLDLAAAASSDLALLRVSCVETESDMAFAALHELLHPLLAQRGELPEPQRQALEGALALDARPPGDRFAVGAAALSLLALAAADGSALILIDDVQWMDQASHGALAFAIRRLGHEGIAVIIAGDERAPPAPRGARELTLGPLARGPAGQLLALRAAVPPPAPVVERILDDTGCCPLAIVDAVTFLSDEQLGGREPLPSPLPIASEMVARLLPAADASTNLRRQLLSAAAADTRAIRVISRAMDDADGAALVRAERQGFLIVSGHQVRFASELVRSALYQAATADERRAAHRAIADALVEERYRDRRAIHLGKAATGPDEYAAAELEWTGDTYRERTGYGVAATTYERAGELSPGDADRSRRLYRAAECAWQAGQKHRAEDLLDRAGGAAGDELLRADVQHLRTLIEIRRNRSKGTTSASLAAAAERIAAQDAARAARMLMTASEAAAPPDRPALLERAVALAERCGPGVSVRASLALASALREAGGTDSAAELAAAAVATIEQHADLRDDPEVLSLAASASDPGPALELSGRAVESARRRGALAVLPHALLLRARLLEATGAWETALIALDEASQQFEASGQSWWAGAARAAAARLEALRGRSAPCLGHLEALEAMSWPDSERLPVTETCRALLRLGEGTVTDAADRLVARLVMPDGAFALDRASELVPDAVEALAYAGRMDEARTLLADTGADTLGQPWLAARMLAARGLVDEEHGGQMLAEAYAQTLALAPDHPYHHARVGLLQGRWLRRHRRVKDCRPPLREAFDIFDRLDASGWMSQVAIELRATNEHPKRNDPSQRDVLTAQELQVARRLAAGLSYKEVAAELIMSTKNVDYHIQKVYKKLGCKKRDLAARLADMPEIP